MSKKYGLSIRLANQSGKLLRAFHALPTHTLPESRSTPAHNLTLANQLGIELGAIERQVDIKVHTVECALGCVHALEILLEILSAEVRGERDNFLDACDWLACIIKFDYDRLTRILGILGANVLITSVQDILVHESRTRSDLSEE